MLKLFPSEKFKEVFFEEKLQRRYAISNFGRLISFNEDFADGKILNGSKNDGYRIFRYKIVKGKKTQHKHKFLYKLVAENFVRKPSENHKHVIHLDRDRGSDHASNLKWVTREQMLEHHRNSPYIKAAQQRLVEFNKKRDGQKLTVTRVMLLKKRLADPNRKTRLKLIAKQFGISEMQLYRIKSGENWGHIKV